MTVATTPVLAIVGAGWAGSAAALWAHRLGFGPCPWWSEGGAVGGCLDQAHNPFWDRLGVGAPAPTGPQLAEALRAQLAQHALAPSAGRVVGLELDGPGGALGLRLEGLSEPQWARHLLLAPGLRPRPWALPGAQALEGRLWGRSASLGVGRAAGQVAVVVGGGDGAAEAASMLAAVCPEVHWLLRGGAPRARQALVAAALACPQVRLHARTQVLGLREGASGGLDLALQGPAGEWALRAGWVVAKLGFAPHTQAFAAQIRVDAEGYAEVDAHHRSLSHPRIFVVGDAASPFQASLAAAEGQAATALKAIQATLPA